MKNTNKLIIKCLFLSALVVLACIGLEAKAEGQEATLTINVIYFGNYTSDNALHTADISSDVYVGSATSPFGTGSVVIPLTSDGATIIDSDAILNVPGLHINRKDGHIKVTTFGRNDSDSREAIKVEFSLQNAIITGIGNSPSHPYEGQGDGICGIDETNLQNSTLNDEYTYSSSSGALCSSTGPDLDILQILYTVQTPNVVCSVNSDCGTNGPTGGLFCQGNSVYQNYINYTCNNAGTPSSYCSSSTTPQLQTTCGANQTCSNGSCIYNNINNCTSYYQQRCSGNNLYWYDSCGNQQGLIQYCPNGCSGGSCIFNNCTDRAYQRCSGNNLYWYDSCGNQQGLAQYCPAGCYNNTCQNYNYNYNVSALTVNKTVRNLTKGSGFATSVSASPSDTLMYMITLQTTGNQDAQNVVVRDSLPGNVIYANQLVVARSGNTYSNYSGDIMSGVNLNDIPSGQIVTITYHARVAPAQNFSYGATTLNSGVSVTSSNSGYVPASNASVVVTRASVLGASNISTGLTNNFWVDSFLLPLLIVLVGIWIWKSGIFIGVEKWMDNNKKVRHGYKSEKELSSRITTIRKSER